MHTDLENLQQNHRSRAHDPLLSHLSDQPPETGRIPLHHFRLAEEPQDPRRGIKGAKHDGDAAVLVHVADGFTAGAGAVDISGLGGGEDGEGGGREAFRGKIDVRAGEGGRGGEEDGLRESLVVRGGWFRGTKVREGWGYYPVAEVVGDEVPEVAHRDVIGYVA